MPRAARTRRAWARSDEILSLGLDARGFWFFSGGRCRAVLVVAVQGQVPQPCVLGTADPVLAPGPAAVAQFQVGELPGSGAGGEAVTRLPSMSVIRSCAPGWGRSLRAITRIPFGHEDRSSRPVSSATQALSRKAEACVAEVGDSNRHRPQFRLSAGVKVGIGALPKVSRRSAFSIGLNALRQIGGERAQHLASIIGSDSLLKTARRRRGLESFLRQAETERCLSCE
jgi:hypothetical protein